MGWTKRLVFTIALGTSAWALVGCGGSSSNAGLPDPKIRFVNASPDSTSLNFFLNDDVKGANLAFGSANAAFDIVDPELYDINVRENGTSVDLDTVTRDLKSDTRTLVVSAGLEEFGIEFSKRLRLTFQDINLTAPNDGKSRLYVYHGFIRQTGFETPNIDFASPGSTPLYELKDISFGGSSMIEVDAGSQTFDVKRNGTDQVYVSSTLNLESGKIYLVLVSGVQAAVGAQAPSIRAIALN